MIEYNLGENQIFINHKIIKLVEPLRKIEIFDDIVIVLFYRGDRDVRFEPRNNMFAYNINTGERIWSIEELIGKNEQCKKWSIKDSLFFEMKRENEFLNAYDFNYHFYISPIERKIVKVEAHR